MTIAGSIHTKIRECLTYRLSTKRHFKNFKARGMRGWRYAVPFSIIVLMVGSGYSQTRTAPPVITNLNQTTAGVGTTVTVTVSPAQDALVVGQVKKYSATVTGTPNTKVTWEVDGVTGGSAETGTIDENGNYTAPSTPGTHTIGARSVANSGVVGTNAIFISSLTAVTGYHANNSRDGANQQEFALNTANVNTTFFGKKFSCATDAQLYAQPLWVANVAMPGGTHNVVIAATMKGTVYAFDGDVSPCQTLWSISANLPGETFVTAADILAGAGCGNLPSVGINGTPVIDTTTNTIYFAAESKTTPGTPTFHWRIHAISLIDGSEKFGGPTDISGSSGIRTFTPIMQAQRPGLALANGVVYIAFGGFFGSCAPDNGWLFGYNATTLTQASVFNVDPVAAPPGAPGGGSLWMSGAAPAVDAFNNVYIVTGIGFFDGVNDFGDSFLKFATSPSFSMSGFFTPFNANTQLGPFDLALGSGGPVLFDSASGPFTHYVIEGGKDGKVYLVNRDNMGGFNPANNNAAVQVWQAAPNEFLSSMSFWNNTLYLAASGQKLQAYTFTPSTGLFTTVASSVTSENFVDRGATVSISSQGLTNGIVWALDNASGTAVLRAYDATNLATELWNSSIVAGDKAGGKVEFTVPTVANGHVYIGTTTELDVYGLKTVPTIVPPLVPASATMGAAAFTLTVNGTNFVSGSTVYFNNIPRTTTFVNATQLTAAILASDVATGGSFPVGVVNPAPAGGDSNAVNFIVNNPVPVITPPLVPASTAAGGAAFTLTVNGSNFVNGATATFGGVTRAVTFVNSGQVTIAVQASDIASAGTPAVVVTNPGPGGGASNAVNFTVTAVVGPPAATTTALAVTSGAVPVTTVVSGSVVTLTATVQAGVTPVTTGQVNFCDASAAFCTDIHLVGTAPLTGAGTAAFKFVPAIGSHSYKAVFVGTSSDATSASGASPLAVTASSAGKNSTTTTLASSGSAGNYTLTATVAGSVNAPGGVSPTGTVNFLNASNGNAVLGTAPLGAGSNGVSWTNSQTPSVGTAPQSIVMGDFNNDGIPDLAVGNNTNVSILIGNGDGTFKAANNITALAVNHSIATAAFINGGPLDIVIASNSVSNVNNAAVIFGNGIGGASSVNPFSVPFGSVSAVATGDFDGDGNQDFVVVGQATNQIAVLLGRGDGTFQIPKIMTAGNSPDFVAVGDLNGDGKLDLVLANSGNGTITVLLGNGDGTFTALPNVNVGLSTSSGPISIAVADLNGDGIPDLAVANQDGTLSTLTGKGGGLFNTQTIIPISPAPFGVAVGDFRGVGIADIAVTNNTGGSVTIFANDGLGNLSLATPPTLQTGNGPKFMAAGKFNGQGSADLAVLNNTDGTVTIQLSQITRVATATATGIAGSAGVVVTDASNGPITSATDSVTAQYLGDSNFLTSTSPAIQLVAGNNPVPVITPPLVPASAIVGGAAFTLTVNGSNFVNGATATFGGVARAVTFVNAGQVTIAVLASDIAATGTPAVVVTNPTPGGGPSNSVNFAVNNPVPVIAPPLVPAGAVAGGAAFTLTVNGSNFVSGATATFGGVARAVTFVNAGQVTIAVQASDIASVGTPAVVVTNPTPGGGPSNSVNFTVTAANNPVPAITSLVPNTVSAGSGAFTLTVNGSGFVNGSVVQWNGSARTTTFVNAGQVTALITAADVQTATVASVTVFNPLPGGGTSNILGFTVSTPIPAITSLVPNSAIAGGPAFTLTVNGSNFINTSVVQWNGVNRTTTFVNSGQLTAQITAADILSVGTASVQVFTPTVVFATAGRPQPSAAPTGTTSNSLTFTINAGNPVPALTSLVPNTKSAGSGGFTLTVNGSNFINGSVVNWNGSARTTTFVNAGQVTALITAADIQSVNSIPVTVFNPAPGGGTSTALIFTITTPVPALTSIVPNSAIAGGAAFTLTLNGSNFLNTSVAQWNGGNRTTTFVNSGQLTAQITAADILTAGTASVQVFTPTVVLGTAGPQPSGAPLGTTSNSLTFTINAPNPVPTLTSLVPNSTGAGGATFTLTLNGTNFISSSVAQWKGSARTTTFVSATQLTASIPASDIAASGTAAATVINPTPGGGTSNALTFTVTDFSVTPTTPTQTVTAGQTANFTIATATVLGAFPGTVTFSASGLPAGANVTFNPSSVSAGGSTTMMVTTTPRNTAQVMPTPNNPRGPMRPLWLITFATMLVLASLTLAKFGRRPQGKLIRRLIPVGALALLLVAVGYMSGCNGGFPRVVTITGTPAGTYPITVTGTSGTDQHSTVVTLTVQ